MLSALLVKVIILYRSGGKRWERAVSRLELDLLPHPRFESHVHKAKCKFRNSGHLHRLNGVKRSLH